jgi:hypothetical protein
VSALLTLSKRDSIKGSEEGSDLEDRASVASKGRGDQRRKGISPSGEVFLQ